MCVDALNARVRLVTDGIRRHWFPGIGPSPTIYYGQSIFRCIGTVLDNCREWILSHTHSPFVAEVLWRYMS